MSVRVCMHTLGSIDMSYSMYQWCGLRPSVLGQDRSDTKKFSLCLGLAHDDLGLAGLVLCCETCSCHTCLHNDFEDHNNFSSTIYSFSYSVLETSLLWWSTMTFTYLKVKSAKCHCWLPVVLVLLFWSWS